MAPLTGVKFIEADAVLAKAREEFRLYFPINYKGRVALLSASPAEQLMHEPVNRIVNALVDGGLDVAIGLANLHNLRDLPPVGISAETS